MTKRLADFLRLPAIMRALVVAALCAACTGRDVRPDDLSAAAHREEARRERSTADARRARAEQLGPVSRKEESRRSAELHADHARQHERAALELERSEDATCRGFAVAERAGCPLLLGVETLIDVPGGVRVEFDRDSDVGRIVAHVRCHLAYERTRGFETPLCPLYLRGVHVERMLDSRVVDILAADPQTVTEVRQRAREQSIPARLEQERMLPSDDE